MDSIYYLLLACICAVGVFLSGVYWRQIVARYKKYRRKLQRKSLAARVEQLEMRVDLHTRKDGVYLNKFDELEQMIDNIAKTKERRENNRDQKVKKIVLDYLKELQKNG